MASCLGVRRWLRRGAPLIGRNRSKLYRESEPHLRGAIANVEG